MFADSIVLLSFSFEIEAAELVGLAVILSLLRWRIGQYLVKYNVYLFLIYLKFVAVVDFEADFLDLLLEELLILQILFLYSIFLSKYHQYQYILKFKIVKTTYISIDTKMDHFLHLEFHFFRLVLPSDLAVL